ncbi:MAG: DUF4340 domain-containing protein [Opitutales bacterium]
MNLKNISILTAVLAVIAGILWIAQASKGGPIQSELVGEGLLDTQTIAEANTIQVFEDQSDSPSVEITKSGDDWTVPGRYGLPADFSKISDLVNELADSKIIRAVTDNPDRIQTLNIGKTRVVFQKGEETLADISFGKEGNTQGYFTRVDRSSKVVLAEEKPFIQTDPEDWSVSTAWDFEWDSVTAISNSDYTFERENAETDFSIAGSESALEQTELKTAFSRLTNLRFQDLAPIGNAEVAEAMEHAMTYSVTLESGESFTFKFGRRPEVKAPEKEENEADASEESAEDPQEDIPAGTPYLIVEQTKASPLWTDIFAKYALEITSFNFEQLPESLEQFVVKPEPEAPEEEPNS